MIARFAVSILAVIFLGLSVDAADLRDQLAAAEKAGDTHAQIELTRRILDEEADPALREQLTNLWLSVDDADMAEQVVTQWPEAPPRVQARVKAEVLYRRDKKPAEAIALLEEYLAKNPDDMPIVRQLTGYLNATDPKAVIAFLNKTPGAEKAIDLLIIRAGAKRSVYDLAGAAGDFSKAEKLDPENTLVVSQRASYDRVRKSLEAIPAATEAIQKNPNDARPLLVRAYWYSHASAGKPALADAEAALALAPNSDAALLMSVLIGNSLGQVPANVAREKYELDTSRPMPPLASIEKLLRADVALMKNPRDAAALANRSAELIALQQYARGLREAEEALAVDPRNETAHTQKILGLIRSGRTDEAAGAVRAFQSTKPSKDKVAAAFSALTEVAFGAGQLENALDSINEAIALRPTAYYYKQRASILTRLDRSEEAEKDLARARQLESGGRR